MADWMWLIVGIVGCVLFVVALSALTSYLWDIPLKRIREHIKKLEKKTKLPFGGEPSEQPKIKKGYSIENFWGAGRMIVEQLPDRNRYWLDIMGHPVVMMTGDKPLIDLEVGDKLSQEAIDFILKNNGLCPFCQEGHLCEGPHGGMAVNYDCNHCRSKVNFMGPFGIEVMIIGSRAYRTGPGPKDGLALVPDTSESPS